MANRAPMGFHLGELDLDVLAAQGLVEIETDDSPEADRELTDLSRRISGQYVEVIATYAQAAFRGARGRSAWSQVEGNLPALARLAGATGDASLAAAITELQELLRMDDGGAGARQRLIPRLRDWLRAFAQLLEGEAADRLEALIRFDRRAFPLLDGLAELRGIGPRRLERLYLAGLFTVESLVDAAPQEVSQATGLPLALSARVVEAAGNFEQHWREQVADDLARRTEEVRSVLRWIEQSGRQDEHMLRAVQESVDDLAAALIAARQALGGEHERK